MSSNPVLRRANPFGLIPFRAAYALLAGVFLWSPVGLIAQTQFEGTLYSFWDVSQNREISVRPGADVTTFDFRGHLVPKGDAFLPCTVVCTEIWYVKDGRPDIRGIRNICYYTDADGDYFRLIGHPLPSEPSADPELWVTEGGLVCDGGIGKYEGAVCELHYRSFGLGGGLARSEIRGTFLLRH